MTTLVTIYFSNYSMTRKQKERVGLVWKTVIPPAAFDERFYYSAGKPKPLEDKPPCRSFDPSLLDQDGLHQDILVRKKDLYFMAVINVKSIGPADQNLRLVMIQDVTMQKKLERMLDAKPRAIPLAQVGQSGTSL